MSFANGMLKINKNAAIIIFFILIGSLLSFIYLKPFLEFSDTMLLRLDWHKEFQLTAATWATITKYKEFPFWNPYKGGGNFLFAHPESNVLSPETLLVLLFGPIKGLYYSVLFFYILGFTGCYFIGRQLRLSFLGTLYLAIVFSFSSYVMNNLFMGASMWMMSGYVPFAFYFLLKSEDDYRYGVAAGFFHALIYLGGAIYIYMLFILFAGIFAASSMIAKRNFSCLKGIATLFIFSFLFASIKILPNLDLYAVNPRETGFQKIPFGFDLLKKAFLDKNQAFDILSAYTYKGENFHFPSYGDYIGVIPIALGIIAIALIKNLKWTISLAGTLLIYLSNYKPFSFVWDFLHRIPPYTALERPARFVIFFVLILGVLGAMLITKIDRLKIKNSKWANLSKTILIYALVLFIFLDFAKASYIIIANFKPMQMQEMPRWEEPFEYYDFLYRFNVSEQQKEQLYANYFKNFAHVDTLSNKGSVRYVYDPIALPKAPIKSKGELDYKGEYYFEKNNSGIIELVKRTPNKISLRLKTKEDSLLVVNQNYHKTWKAKEEFEVINHQGLLSVKVPKGEHSVNLYMFQEKILAGLLLSLIGIVLGAYLLIGANKTKSKA